MGAEKTHRDLAAWQAAMDLVETVYQQTSTFPKEETFGLTIQVRRAAVSVPSNIAEGAARNTSREFFQYLGVAAGSVAELETQVELAIRLKYLPKNTEALVRARRVGRLVHALRNSVKPPTSQE
jgi:four helix bundle protein